MTTQRQNGQFLRQNTLRFVIGFVRAASCCEESALRNTLSNFGRTSGRGWSANELPRSSVTDGETVRVVTVSRPTG